MNMLLAAAIEFAIKNGVHRIPCSNYNQANNLRQRFYRWREELRNNDCHPFHIFADELSFSLSGKVLVIEYSKSEEESIILESLNDHEITSEAETQASKRKDIDEGTRQNSRPSK